MTDYECKINETFEDLCDRYLKTNRIGILIFGMYYLIGSNETPILSQHLKDFYKAACFIERNSP
jgi:hypothetical protein